MSTITASPQQRRLPPSPDGGAVPDHYIESQLNRTRRDVKLVDLSSSFMVLVAGVVGYLLVVAIVDHWVLPLAGWGRWLLLGAMATAALWYCIAVVLPLIVGRINPVYAAWTIERSEPSLNNSVINYLLFRQDRAGLRAGIYDTLKQRAASDLARVPVDSAVDRTRLIRIGYGLIAILVLFAAYTMLSPKSPLTTARRVIVPWADIEAPTRVRIEEVSPGSQQVFHGDTITVSAKCYDLYKDEPATLVYSSLDGRISEQMIRMQSAGVGASYQSSLPPDGDGIQQDLVYRIEAGDAVTASYRLTVLPAPTLLVQRVEYEYPAYTRQPPRVVEREGDVRGVEGTRVTIRAQSNQPIRWATIVLDPAHEREGADDAKNAATSRDDSARIVSMQSDDRQAWGAFTLEMEPGGIRPKHTAYQLRFETKEGQPNSHAPLHRIEVTRDLTPEIEVLTPAQDRINLPVDSSQQIEVRAIDPDYGLRNIQLRGVAGGVDLLSKTLLDDAEGRTGQVVTSYDFEPWKHGLNPGDALVFWAVAADNRVSPSSGDPEPNLAKTRTYHITILPPENPPTGAPEPTPADPNEDPGAPPNPVERPEAGPTDRETSSDQAAGPKPADGQGPQGDQAGQQEKGDNGDPSGAATGTDDGSSQSSPTETQQGGAGSSTSPDSGGGGGSQTGGASGDSSSGTSQPGGGGGQPGSSGGTQNSDGNPMQDSPSGDGGPSPSSTSPGQGASGNQQPPSSDGAATATGQQATGDEPLHDGEVIERTLEYMKSQPPDDSSTQQPGGQSGGEPQPAQGANDQRQAGTTPDRLQGDRPQQALPDGSATTGSSPDGSPKPGSKQDPTASSQPNQQQGETSMGGGGQQQEDRNQGAGQQKDGSSGQGGNPRGPSETRQETSQSDSAGGEPKQGGLGDNGQSGAGQNSEDTSGSAAAEKKNRDRPKEGSASGGEPKPSEGAQAPSQSDRQSDSQGDSEGDQSGGGRKGPGQGAGQSGNDSGGSQSSADQGSGASQESGSGDTARRPGDQQIAEDPTNTPGTQKGPGSSTQPTPGGQGRGRGAKSDSQSDSQTAERPTGQPTPGEVDHRGQGLPLGGGRPSAADLKGFDLTGEVPPGEEPNVEYARRATDLVLEYLKDQQQKPDPKLLEKLGWTEDDLRQFLQRWEQMRQSASRDELGRNDLNETLRSLGLRPDQRDARRVTVRDDQVQGLQDAGAQSNPPPKYLEQFNAYKKGTARVHE